MSIHVIGILGLVLVFVIGTTRPINLGALALVATFLVGAIFVGESPSEMYGGFPVDLLVLLAGITYLFGIASNNGTVEWIVEGSTRLAGDRRALIPWVVFVVASLPAMAGALGSAGVALLAPLALRIARRYDIDRRMIGLMVVHGAAAGNFSPLNVLGAIVQQAVASNGLAFSASSLFFGNVAYNVALAGITRRARCSRCSVWRPAPLDSACPSAFSRSRRRPFCISRSRHPVRAPRRRSHGTSCCSCAAS
jgi:Na+/H+ antiporter NhaC